MYKVEGYWNVEPKIKKIDFPVRGKIQIDFEDGRRLISPLSAFPCIKVVGALLCGYIENGEILKQ